MGQAIDKKIRQEYQVISTPEYVTAIGKKVAALSGRPDIPYVIRVIKKKELNAFAVPGGYIYLHTGLLDKIEANDELACIIGHEMTHIVARDGVHQMEKSLLYSIPTSILLGDGRHKAIQQAVDAAFTLTMLKYSRQEELRADQYGVTYAYRAGYNPDGMIIFFKKLQKMENTELTKYFEFLQSHPDVEQRIRNVEAVISQLRSTQ
jgi:predicted Zn-dependent protease